MKKIILTLLFTLTFSSAAEPTPSDVYAKCMQIHHELDTIKSHFGLNKEVKLRAIHTNFLPRHTWQRTYELFIKINMFRVAQGFTIIEPVNLEPKRQISSILTYEQTLRLLTELRILKYRLNIKTSVPAIKRYRGKNPKDVFALLGKISKEIDILNGSSFTPSYVFGEAMRAYDDVNLILSHLNIKDATIPAKKVKNAKPSDTFNTAMKLLLKIRDIKSYVGLSTVDFSQFTKKRLTPSDVFSITEIIISELQIIKAYLGISTITASAKLYTQKTPADVDQLMSWNLRKLTLIKTLTVQK